MKIHLIYIGKSNKNFYKEAQERFVKRLGHYCQLSITCIPPAKNAHAISATECKKKEETLILDKLGKNQRYYLLDEGGRQYSSVEFASFLERTQLTDSSLCFVIGGALGVSEAIKKNATQSLALSKMTLPHHLARILFLEQLYRSYSIINNHSYHNE